jgi:hypothetical protein
LIYRQDIEQEECVATNSDMSVVYIAIIRPVYRPGHSPCSAAMILY